MIPENIDRKLVLKAIEEVKRTEIPKRRKSKKFDMKFEDNYFPPKYVISLANKYANGEELNPEGFSGGSESNDFLRALGFEILEKKFSKENCTAPRYELRKTTSSKVHHNERCPKCKETAKELLQKIYGKVEQNYKFQVGTHLEDFSNASCYSELKQIYKALQDYRGLRDFVKAKTLPNCDFFIPNPGLIVEFDESQHFTATRKITLEMYPNELGTGFSIKKWIELCEKINARDNHPTYRDEQRAWYDTLRDFLPVLIGLKPTVRLFARDFVWCSLDPENVSDVERFRSMITAEQRRTNDFPSTKIVLCMPNREQSDKDRSIWQNKVVEFAKNVAADLIVFPESYVECKFDCAASEVRKLSEKIGFAVLSGVHTEEGYELAVFCNPRPRTEETTEHLYIKHSSATRLAYEWPKYRGRDDRMFDPILFHGRKIGVMLCHDMFFPLIGNTLAKHGAEILVDLTGGNVNFQKWNNIVQARSLEIQGAFLCTMGYNPKGNGRSSCIAYENGRKVPFLIQSAGKTLESFEGPEPPGFAVVAIPCDHTIPEQKEQSFSNMIYTDITISFNKDREADLEIIKTNDEIRVSNHGKILHPDADHWVKTKKGNKIIGLFILPLKDLSDGTSILKKKPQSPIDFYFVLYCGEKLPLRTNSDLITFAKLRAIENRVGILILTDERREALKTTKYKNIQRFKEKNGVFGFNEECLGGPESVFSQSRNQGIAKKFKEKYLELLT
jgi:predicted amidohydrolase